MKRKKCQVCRRRDVVDINLKLATGKKGSTRAVADEYGIDYYTLQKHRGHRSFRKGPKPKPSEETMQCIEEGEEFIRKNLLQMDESGELLRRYLHLRENHVDRSG